VAPDKPDASPDPPSRFWRGRQGRERVFLRHSICGMMVGGSATDTTKPMDRKTKKKLITDARKYADDLPTERLLGINPIFLFLSKFEERPLTEKISSKEFQQTQLTNDSRWIEQLEEDFKNTKVYMNKYVDTLRDVVYCDQLYIQGCIEKFSYLSSSVDKFVKYCICPLSNENRYKQVKKIEEDGLLHSICLTILKLETYSICDELNDKWGKQITEYCTNNNTKIIIELLDEEYKDKSKSYNNDVVSAMTFQDIKMLRDCIRKNEKFYIYRGFSVKETDMVRKGKKSEGDLYYLQNAGTGMSYSLDENIAYFFTHRSITDIRYDEEFQNNRYYNTENTWYVPSDKYIDTKTEELKVIRDKKKLKPILCKYECDPSKIKGYRFDAEKEIIIRPEDLKVIHYEIPNSNTIATRHWEWLNMNMSCLSPNMLHYGAIANGLTALPTKDSAGNAGYIFAETERVRDTLEELIDYGMDVTDDMKDRVFHIFLQKSVEIPENINPFVFGDGLWEYMQNPTNIKRKPNTHYQTKTTTLKKKIKSVVNKGFG